MHQTDQLPGDQAIALCKLAQLVGDAHQPCHAGSLFATGPLPEGDRGANSISHPPEEQHARVLDGLLGRNYDGGPMNRRVQEIADSAEMAAIGEEALTTLNALAPLTWPDESRDAADAIAYTHEVLGPVKVVMDEGGEVPEVYFSENYPQHAGKLAQLRAAAAGRRLAAIWRAGID